MANDAQENVSATNLQLFYSYVLFTNVQTLSNYVSTRILIHALVLTLYFWIWSKICLWVVVLNHWMPFIIWLKPYLQLLCWTNECLSWSDQSLTSSCCVELMDVCHDPKPYLDLLCWTNVHLSWSDRSLTLSCCVESIDVCHDLTYVLPWVVVFNQCHDLTKVLPWVVVFNQWTSVMIWPKSYLELLCLTNGRLSWSDQSLTLSCCV